MNKEAIEEAANNWIKNTSEFLSVKNGFIEGAKWQAERMYSEEDMTNYAMFILLNKLITPKEWFEQFKKK
jgi:hypothetical protein